MSNLKQDNKIYLFQEGLAFPDRFGTGLDLDFFGQIGVRFWDPLLPLCKPMIEFYIIWCGYAEHRVKHTQKKQSFTYKLICWQKSKRNSRNKICVLITAVVQGTMQSAKKTRGHLQITTKKRGHALCLCVVNVSSRNGHELKQQSHDFPTNWEAETRAIKRRYPHAHAGVLNTECSTTPSTHPKRKPSEKSSAGGKNGRCELH